MREEEKRGERGPRGTRKNSREPREPVAREAGGREDNPLDWRGLEWDLG